MADHEATIRRFLTGLEAGDVPTDIFAEDARAWTTSSGAAPAARYAGAGPVLRAVFGDTLRYTVHSITSEADRAAVEATGSGRFGDGGEYANTYLFMFHFDEAGRIASVAEHFDPAPFNRDLGPRIAKVVEEMRG